MDGWQKRTMVIFLYGLIKLMNSIGNELLKGISSLPSFFIISIFITGCSAEFKENFNQGFQNSLDDGSYISSCMVSWDFVKTEISRIKFLNYCQCSAEEIKKNGEFQLSTIMPGNLKKITDYCYRRELIP